MKIRFLNHSKGKYYELIGKKLKHEFVDNDAWIISYRQECFDSIGMRPSTKYALFNGARVLKFMIETMTGEPYSEPYEWAEEVYR